MMSGTEGNSLRHTEGSPLGETAIQVNQEKSICTAMKWVVHSCPRRPLCDLHIRVHTVS